MIIEILFVVTMFLWFLSLLPYPPLAPFASASSWLAFIAVLLLGLAMYVPALGGSTHVTRLGNLLFGWSA
jgi:hypothetical protein